ncbi:hypothetical protein SARC_10508, partial [Sphaeroforma arctica JP610]
MEYIVQYARYDSVHTRVRMISEVLEGVLGDSCWCVVVRNHMVKRDFDVLKSDPLQRNRKRRNGLKNDTREDDADWNRLENLRNSTVKDDEYASTRHHMCKAEDSVRSSRRQTTQEPVHREAVKIHTKHTYRGLHTDKEDHMQQSKVSNMGSVKQSYHKKYRRDRFKHRNYSDAHRMDRTDHEGYAKNAPEMQTANMTQHSDFDVVLFTGIHGAHTCRSINVAIELLREHRGIKYVYVQKTYTRSLSRAVPREGEQTPPTDHVHSRILADVAWDQGFAGKV